MDYHQSSSTNVDTYSVLERCLKDILSLITPSESDRQKRKDTISDLSSLVASVESLKSAAVRPFGSFVSNLYTRWGDLDISVEVFHVSHISICRKDKQKILRDIMRALQRTGVGQNFTFIPQARVPLLIYESNHQKISCDVSINNHLGRIKSKFLLWVSDIDERFHDMVLLTKEWAKAKDINNAKCGTLNSYSLCLLVIFHLQTCNPAILPPLEEIYGTNIVDDVTGDGFITEKYIEDTCIANIARFKSRVSRERNQSSLSQLLVSFFEKFSRIETFARVYAISTRTGQWEFITSNPLWTEKSFSLLIEDPFEQPDNASRAVGPRELNLISNAFSEAHRKLCSRSMLSDRNSLLSNLVGSHIRLQLETRNQRHFSSHYHYMSERTSNHFQYGQRVDGRHQSSSSTSNEDIRQQVWRPTKQKSDMRLA